MAELVTIGRGTKAKNKSRERKNKRKKRKAERRQTRVSLLHLPAKRAPCAGRARLSAFHGGSALGTHASQGAISDQVSRSRRLGGGDLPPAPAPVTASTSRAGRNAGGLMSETARVQRGRTLRPRAPHPLPPAVRHRLTSFYAEREAGVSSRPVEEVKRCRNTGDYALISRRFLLRPLFSAAAMEANSCESKNHRASLWLAIEARAGAVYAVHL